jgi:hypothetical protein
MGKFGEALRTGWCSPGHESPGVRPAAINAGKAAASRKGIGPLISSLWGQRCVDSHGRRASDRRVRQPRSVEPLMRHLEADHPPVRIAVIQALGKVGQPNVRNVLFRCANDTDVEIRRAAVLALAKVGGEDVFRRLIDVLSDQDWRIRAAAATALGIRGDPKALPPLHRALEDADTYVQRSGAGARSHSDRGSFPFLFRALEEPGDHRRRLRSLRPSQGPHRDLIEQALARPARQPPRGGHRGDFVGHEIVKSGRLRVRKAEVPTALLRSALCLLPSDFHGFLAQPPSRTSG